MCGIAGQIYADNTHHVDQPLIQGMIQDLVHRGPDGQGIYINKHVGLGHRRLSINDLSDQAKQPIANEDESLWLVCNGEIYNAPELTQQLIAKGHRFRSRNDNEVILHLYEEYGTECVQHLRGMFAFALWDKNNDRLMLARDRIGQKPLYYTCRDGYLAFASELRSLMRLPDHASIDPSAIHHYLTYQYIPAPMSIFKQVHKLEPAHYLIYEKGKLQHQRYWDLNYQPKHQDTSIDGLQERWLQLLKESIKLRLLSDVPVGAFLSGGLDSGSIVSLMAELSNQPVKTFSIGFEHQAYNELPLAKQVAERYTTDHHEFIVQTHACDDLPKLAWHYAEPFADSSALPSYYLARETKNHVSVALNGDGGDESLGGYLRYIAQPLATKLRLIPAPVRHQLIQPLLKSMATKSQPKNVLYRLRRLFEGLDASRPHQYLNYLCFFNAGQKRGLYHHDFAKQVSQYDSATFMEAAFHDARNYKSLDQLLAVDVSMYLPGALMCKMDIASMAHGLEARSPFLDHKLMEFSARLPTHLKIKGFKTKYLMRQAMKDRLPSDVLQAKKSGFSLPLAPWFRNELKSFAYDTLLSKQAMARNYFNAQAVQQLLDEHVSGKNNHEHRIWALLMLELWHQAYGL